MWLVAAVGTLKPLLSKAKRFGRSAKGNTTIIFGLSSTLLVAAAGGGVDFSRSTAARAHMQDAADAAVLRGAVMAKQGEVKAQAAADQAFAYNLKDANIENLEGDLAVKVIGNMTEVTYTATGKVDSLFLGLVGMEKVNVSVFAKAQTIMRKAEIALVLDDSGSMDSGGRMTNLKSSVDSVLANLLNDKGINASDTKVAVVPFDSRVKITPATDLNYVNYGQASYADIKCHNSSCSNLTYRVSYDNGYGPRSAYNLTVKNSNGYNRTVTMPAISDQKSQWDGCLIDRDQSYDVNETAANPTTGVALYHARPCVSASSNYTQSPSLSPVRGLTTDIADTRDYVSKLDPSNMTNITIGLQWGLEVLSPSQPFGGGVAFDDTETLKYMIVVTDGENTSNRWSGTASTINARTTLACERAKALGVTVYVVRVMAGNSTMLRNCASKTDYYYDLSSASQLNSALTDVFNSIKTTRLTQ